MHCHFKSQKQSRNLISLIRAHSAVQYYWYLPATQTAASPVHPTRYPYKRIGARGITGVAMVMTGVAKSSIDAPVLATGVAYEVVAAEARWTLSMDDGFSDPSSGVAAAGVMRLAESGTVELLEVPVAGVA